MIQARALRQLESRFRLRIASRSLRKAIDGMSKACGIVLSFVLCLELAAGHAGERWR